MEDTILEIKDKSGRQVYLTRERWKHINWEHPEVANCLEEIKETLKSPIKITEYSYDENARYYYKHFKERRSSAKYLLVIVKYLNGGGFIITSYFVRNIK